MSIKNVVEQKLNEMRSHLQMGDGPEGIQLFWRNENDFSVTLNNKHWAYDGTSDIEEFLANLGQGETVEEKMAKGAKASEKEEMESKGLLVKTASAPTVSSLNIFKDGVKITDECSFEKTGRASTRELYHGEVKIGDIVYGKPTLLDDVVGYTLEVDENFPREKLKTPIKEPKIGKAKKK